jgi:hypothetical protein
VVKVSQGAAGADGGELAVVPDEEELGVGVEDLLAEQIEVWGRRHSGFVHDHEIPRLELLVASAGVEQPLVDGVGLGPDLVQVS